MHAAQVVADVFAKADGARAAVFVEVAGFNEAATDVDDGRCFPFLLDLTG